MKTLILAALVVYSTVSTLQYYDLHHRHEEWKSRAIHSQHNKQICESALAVAIKRGYKVTRNGRPMKQERS